MWFAIIAALIVTIGLQYFNGSIRPELGLRGVTPSALAHISVLLGLLALVKAYQYYLGTFALNFSERGVVTGASYTDVHAQLPALRLLAIISILSAILFLVNIRVTTAVAPAGGGGHLDPDGVPRRHGLAAGRSAFLGRSAGASA